MGRVLPCRFHQCLQPFTILLVKGSSETRLFRHSSNHLLHSLLFRKYISNDGHHFFSKCSIFDLHLNNDEKDSEKVFSFLDNII